MEVSASARLAASHDLRKAFDAEKRELCAALAQAEQSAALLTSENENLLCRIAALDSGTRVEVHHGGGGGGAPPCAPPPPHPPSLLPSLHGENSRLAQECARLNQLLDAERASAAVARAEAVGAGGGGGASPSPVRAQSDAALLRRQLLEIEKCRADLTEARVRSTTYPRSSAAPP